MATFIHCIIVMNFVGLVNMAFIYDRKDETVIEYNPLDKIKFIANDPKTVKWKSNPHEHFMNNKTYAGNETRKRLIKTVLLPGDIVLSHYVEY